MTDELTAYPIVKTGLSRHGHQYGESVKFRQWIADTLSPLVEIQAAFLSLLDVDLDTASDIKLDLIGRLIGAPAVIPSVNPVANLFGFDDQDLAEPFGELDGSDIGGYWRELGESSYSGVALPPELYRTVIRAQILKNSSLCTPPDIIRIARMIIGSETNFVYIEYPMVIIIAPTQNLSRLQIELLRLLIPRPCGVGLAVVNEYYDDFGFADQDFALPMSELNDPTIGGYWSTVNDDLQLTFDNGENGIWL